MANRTDPQAATVHGTNPQNLIEKIVRSKIYECTYWKAHCFALNAETLIDRAVELKSVGGTYGGTRKPTDFICLVLKMLQIQPEKEIITEFILNEDYKYLRLLGAFYLRLTGKGPEVYRYLEPLYNDYRKVRMMNPDGNYVLTHVDEVVDMMLQKDHLFDVTMPFIASRQLLERTAGLEPRISVLDEEFDEMALAAEAAEAGAAEAAAAALEQEMLAADDRSGRDRDWDRDRDRDRERGRDRSRSPRRRGRSGSRERKRSRSRDRERDRERERERGREKWRERDDKGSRADKDSGRKRRERERSGSPRKEGKRRVADPTDPEIQAINAERAKLGLRPLK